MQYSKAFTDALQFMWGEGFLSPGGPEEVDDMLQGYVVSGRRVLDIGSGLGGVDALLVSRHGADEVIGVDVEEQLVEASIALIANKGLSDRVKFRLVEPGPLPFRNNSFDMVFSKDAMVHIPEQDFCLQGGVAPSQIRRCVCRRGLVVGRRCRIELRRSSLALKGTTEIRLHVTG
jgi:SAM-dependent methyltransferase